MTASEPWAAALNRVEDTLRRELEALLRLQAESVPGMAPPTAIWPTSVAGYLGIVLSALAIGAAIWGYAKSAANSNATQKRMVEQLNGMGERMKRLEDAHEQHRGAMEKLDRAVESTLRAQGELLLRIGAAEKHAEDAEDRAVQLGVDIGSAITKLGEKLNAFEGKITNRMTALVVELRTLKVIGNAGDDE